MPRNFRRVLVLANPTAGLRGGRRAGEAVARTTGARGLEVELVMTGGPGDAERLAAGAAAAGFDLVLAVGGDGTAHEVVNGVAGTAVAVGVAPAGTMNLLARVLDLPLDPVGAARAVMSAPRWITVRPGRAGERLFVLMAGIGLDAWVLRELKGRVEGKIAFRHYVAGALRGVFSYPYPEIRLRFPDGPPLSCTSAVLGRAALYGGFLRPTPSVALTDPTLELCALTPRSTAEALRLLPLLWTGSHIGRPGVHDRRVTAFDAETDHSDLAVQLDGELAGRLPMSFGLSDRTLTLVC